MRSKATVRGHVVYDLKPPTGKLAGPLAQYRVKALTAYSWLPILSSQQITNMFSYFNYLPRLSLLVPSLWSNFKRVETLKGPVSKDFRAIPF